MNKRIYIISLFLLFTMMKVNSQTIIKLWPEGAPSSNELKDAEQVGDNYSWILNVSEAELWIYQAEKNKANGMAVIICPGGGYSGLAFNHEGIQFAEWLNKQGITAAILKYRMPNEHTDIPLADAREAIKYIRLNAGKLEVNPNKVGIAGFSAGGHLASTLSTHIISSEINTRPDFSILFYPVITMGTVTHGGSRTNLLGDNPSPEDVLKYSNEKQVTDATPPAILLLSDDDDGVPPINSTQYYEALKNKNIPATMYIFPEGRHGWGMNKDFKYHSQMLDLLAMWLKDI
ncbi:alpha/beta hydrolase [Dysgonomonas sp. ZJ709]|uniref:alpha/beta hydrolase n=1 Tax=Dysgonomonas sp. ZJ709 TaxID=2709797 RepID=UPI0013EB284E|nr:alpha/beta hydrolase [Dysgonomonas sp. ZJ709]